MRIVKVDAIPVSIPLRKPFTIAGGTSSHLRHLITRVHTDEGIVGIGEAAPTPTYSEETQRGAKAVIDECLAPVILGESPLHLEEITHRMDEAIPGHTLAKAGVEIAIWDALGKHLKLPVYEFLGGSHKDKIPVAGSISMGTPEEMSRDALGYVEEGFTDLKVKIGRNPDLDAEAIAAIRDAVGSKVKIRLDANQGYTKDVAIKTLRRMERYDLQLIEQPVDRRDFEAMREIRLALETPISADEGVFTPRDAVEAIRRSAVDIINVKVMKPGGLYNARKILYIAEAAGIPCLVGSMSEMDPGTAAGIHFAVSYRNIRYASEMFGPSVLTDFIAKNPIKVEGGFLGVPRGPGFGVELDEEKIQRYSRGT
ncbi:MAG: mandelate racemase/muconate lactonizing enzyme family protein [Candidatus Geothermarchaeales archaeon]